MDEDLRRWHRNRGAHPHQDGSLTDTPQSEDQGDRSKNGVLAMNALRALLSELSNKYLFIAAPPRSASTYLYWLLHRGPVYLLFEANPITFLTELSTCARAEVAQFDVPPFLYRGRPPIDEMPLRPPEDVVQTLPQEIEAIVTTTPLLYCLPVELAAGLFFILLRLLAQQRRKKFLEYFGVKEPSFGYTGGVYLRTLRRLYREADLPPPQITVLYTLRNVEEAAASMVRHGIVENQAKARSFLIGCIAGLEKLRNEYPDVNFIHLPWEWLDIYRPDERGAKLFSSLGIDGRDIRIPHERPDWVRKHGRFLPAIQELYSRSSEW